MPSEWDTYVAGYHDANPGITEDLLAGAGDDRGRSPYDWVVEAVPAGAATVVDLACGSGPLAPLLAGAKVVGVDRSAGELARASGPRVRAEASAVPFVGGCADAVVTSMALMLMHPLEAVLEEVARLLRPGGTFVATVPVRSGSAGTLLFAKVLRALGQAAFDYPETLGDAPGERFEASGLHLRTDDRALFSRTVRPEEAEGVVRSFYAPGAAPDQVARAVELLEREAPVEVDYPIRRLVAIR